MKKLVLFFIAFLFIFTSCEDDDFCNDPTTPRLIIVFYDKDNTSTKLAVPIYVWAEGKDSIYNLVSTDSILLPLDTKEPFSRYRFSKERVVDTLDLSYTTSDFFVSEACGYIALFNDFGVNNSTNNWIDHMEIDITKIEDETETHIKIYH